LEKFLPRKPEKEIISMRIPIDILEKVDQQAAAADISRNEFINQCITFALAHMDGSAEN
jgi:predicted HicB family RNase H-like nuclease